MYNNTGFLRHTSGERLNSVFDTKFCRIVLWKSDVIEILLEVCLPFYGTDFHTEQCKNMVLETNLGTTLFFGLALHHKEELLDNEEK